MEIKVFVSKVPSSSLFNLQIEPWEHLSRGTILMQQNPNINVNNSRFNFFPLYTKKKKNTNQQRQTDCSATGLDLSIVSLCLALPPVVWRVFTRSELISQWVGASAMGEPQSNPHERYYGMAKELGAYHQSLALKNQLIGYYRFLFLLGPAARSR